MKSSSDWINGSWSGLGGGAKVGGRLNQSVACVAGALQEAEPS